MPDTPDWHHVVLTQDGDDRKGYLDGRRVYLRSPTMPDTPDNMISRAIRPKTKAGQALAARYGKGNVANAILAIEAEAAAAHLDALTVAVEKLPLYDENARTMADAAESMRSRAVAILRGEQ